MINKQQLCNLVLFDTNEIAKFEWNCYGNSAIILDCWDKTPESWSVTAVVDALRDLVYEVSISDVEKGKTYRLFADEYSRDAFFAEANKREVDPYISPYGDAIVDLESAEDFLDKAEAIIDGREYEDTVVVPVDISKEDFATLARQAHDEGITFNQHIVNILYRQLQNQNNIYW